MPNLPFTSLVTNIVIAEPTPATNLAKVIETKAGALGYKGNS